VPFADIQYRQLIAIIEALLATYPQLSRQHITGHENIAPGRKTDPGVFFNWQRLSKQFGVNLPT
jgi:AmpD protein